MREYNSKERLDACLKRVQEIAATHNGKCVSTEYLDGNTDLVFECSKHGQFAAKPRHIVAGHWCMKCRDDAKKVPTKERLEEYIQMRGGKLMSEYINARTHVTVECPVHGPWSATPTNLVGRNSWCMRCARSAPRPGRRKLKHKAFLVV